MAQFEGLSSAQLHRLDLGVITFRRTGGQWRVETTNDRYLAGLPERLRDRPLTGRRLDEFLPAAAVAVAAPALERAAAGQRVPAQVTTVSWPEGPRSYRWTATGEGTLVTIVMWDATEDVRRRRQAAAHDAERSAVLDVLPQATLLIEPTGAVRFANRAARDLLGTRLLDGHWSPLAEELVPLGGRSLDGLLLEALAGGQPAPTEARLGADVVLRVQAGAVHAPRGEVAGAALVLTDLSDERRLAAQRKELLNRELTAHEQAASTLAATLHDGVLQTLAELAIVLNLAEQGAAPATPAELRPYVERAAAQCRDLVVDLLPAGLEDGLDAALDAQLAEWRARGLVAVARSGARLPRFAPWRERLVFAVALEALRNARRHAAGSRITVTTDVADGSALLVVHDEGPGLEQAAADRAAAAGHLGLALSRERMEAAGGSWSVHATSRCGTTVTLRWPLEQAGAVAERR